MKNEKLRMKRSSTGLTGSPAWPRVRLGDVCEFVYGFPFDSEKFNTEGKGCKLVRIRDVVPGDSSTYTTEEVSDRYAISNGDLMVGMDGDFNVAKWRGGQAVLNQRVCRFVPNEEKLSLGFIEFALIQYLREIWENKSFSTVKHLSAKDLNSITFPLPPISVQREIVARLEKELAAVDKMEAGFKAMAEAADAEFKATLKETFEGLEKGEDGSTGTDGTTGTSGVVGSRVPRDRGHAGRVPLPAVKRVKLGEVCEVLDSRRKPVTKKNRVQGDIPYYGATGIVDYVADYIFDEQLVLLGEDGAKWGPGDNSAFIIEGKTWVNNHAHVLRPKEIIDDQFLVFQLNSADLSDSITGVTVPKLNQQKMCDIAILLPPLATQRSIVARLDTARSRCEKLKAAAEKGAETAAVMRKAILKESFE